MLEVMKFVRANDAYLLLGISVLTLVLLVHAISLSRKLAAVRKRREARLANGRTEDIIDCITDQSNILSDLQSRFEKLEAKQNEQAGSLAGCLRNIGMVRFNAFDDVGGEQSFALALLDAKRSGIVVSSLYGRQDSRLYAKSVVNGEGERALSDEERKALERALA